MPSVISYQLVGEPVNFALFWQMFISFRRSFYMCVSQTSEFAVLLVGGLIQTMLNERPSREKFMDWWFSQMNPYIQCFCAWYTLSLILPSVFHVVVHSEPLSGFIPSPRSTASPKAALACTPPRVYSYRYMYWSLPLPVPTDSMFHSSSNVMCGLRLSHAVWFMTPICSTRYISLKLHVIGSHAIDPLSIHPLGAQLPFCALVITQIWCYPVLDHPNGSREKDPQI